MIGQEDEAGNYLSYHSDLRGSTTLLTDEHGRVRDRYTYDPYGKVESHEGDTRQPFQYNGRDGVMTDPNGLYYMRARYYHPVLKRFLNRDVIRGDLQDGQTFNRYAYVNGDPIRYIDPLGLMKQDCPRAGKGNGATFEGTLYRSVGEGHDPLLIHQGNIIANHRYTAPGTGGLYFSTGEKIVNAELNTWNVATNGRVMHAFDVKIDNLLDVSSPNVRKQLGITLEGITGNSYDVTHRIGQYAKNNGYSGLVAPSARADGGLNIILFDGSIIGR